VRREGEPKVAPLDGDKEMIEVSPEVIFTGKTPNHEEITLLCVTQRALALTLYVPAAVQNLRSSSRTQEERSEASPFQSN